MSSLDVTTALAAFIDKLYDLASTQSIEKFKSTVFCELETFLNVDAGIWFSRSDMDRPLVEYWQEDTHLFGLPDDFMGNYQRLVQSSNEADPFHELVLSRPNKVVSIEEAYDSLAHWRETIYYQKHSGLFGLKDVITVLATPEDGLSQTTHVISLYRKEPSPLFSFQDKQLFGFLYPLFKEAFRTNLFSMVNDNFIREQNNGVLAVVDRYGLVLESDKDFDKILDLDPSVSLSELVKKICGDDRKTNLSSDKLDISVTFASGLFFVRILPSRFINELNPEQRSLCQMIRKGYSDIDISRHLDISHRQVRYLIEQTFSGLGVSNRNNIFMLLVRFGIG